MINELSFWASILTAQIILAFFIVFYICYTIKELKAINEKLDLLLQSKVENNNLEDSKGESK